MNVHGIRPALIGGLCLLVLASGANARRDHPFVRTEQREDCDRYEPLRQPLFGDLHVHTSYSFDSYVSSQRNDPSDAYRFGKGEAITLPDADGEQTVVAKLRRPLDFLAVTDHSEYLGEVDVCSSDDWSLGGFSPLCLMTNSRFYIVQLLAASWFVGSGVTGQEKERNYLCSLPGDDCSGRAAKVWRKIQRAAEEAYDRTSACSFTSFVAYEYSDAPNYQNIHRNVIYRNRHVSPIPISAYDTGSNNVPELWRRLREGCIEAGNGCDVLAIPHNPNLSGGLMFPDPRSRAEAKERRFFEPLVEMMQHKGASECRYDRLAGRGLDTADELCAFEQIKTDNLAELGVLYGEMRTERGAPVPIDEYARRNMVRNVLKDGLALKKKYGIDPFEFGFIGSTDTHSATPGAVDERDFKGHLGRRDAGYRNVQDHFADSPGGLAVVWAEENSRDAIFEAMRRREAYATSGTRPIVRFFGGWNFATDLCSVRDREKQAYASGVPMGSELPPRIQGRKPRFLTMALKDPGVGDEPGTDLQRVQIVKGWLEADGSTHERVLDVAGEAGNGATVDQKTCQPVGKGFAELCTLWEDDEFDPGQSAFYYARILENPSCRWSTLQCMQAGVNPFSPKCGEQARAKTREAHEKGGIGDVYGNCCVSKEKEPFYSPVIQERAWTSPIWYSAQGS